MKKLINLLFSTFTLILFLFLLPSSVSAATKYWVGGNGDSATTNANDWSTTNPSACNDGGGNASAVPGSGDVAIFDPDCDNNSAISSNWSVQKIDLQSGYIGTVTQNSTVTVTIDPGTSGDALVIAGGTFTGGDSAIDINDGNFNQSGGTFTNSSGNMTVEHDFTVSGGTFTNTGQTVTFNGSDISDESDLTCSGTLSGTIVFTKTGTWGLDIVINSGCTISLGTNPVTTLSNNSSTELVNYGTMVIESGTWTIQNTTDEGATASFTNVGTVTHNGTGWDINDVTFGNLGSGAITYSGTSITVDRSFSIGSSSTFDLTGITVTLDGTADADDATLYCSQTISGNLTINKTHATGNTTLGGNCTIAGTFTRTDGPVANPASAYTLTVQGDFSMSTTDTFGGANMTFAMGGGSTQTITQNAGSIAGPFTVNKSAGTASIASGLNLSTGSTCTVVEGTFGINGRTFTCGSTFTVEDGGTLQRFGTSGESLTTPTLNSGSTVTYTGDGDSAADTITITTMIATYHHLTINSTDGTTDTFQLGADLDINGLMTLTAGTLDVSSSNYGITVGGGWTDTGAGTFTEGTGTVTFDGTGTINSNETFNNIAISAGTLTVSTNTLQAGGTFALSGGTLDMNGVGATMTGASTLSGGTYTASTGTQTFNGAVTVSGATFTGSSGTVDINNTLSLSSGTFTAPSSSGSFTVSGNLAISGGTFTHNSGTITFDAGSGTQTLNAGGASINNVSHNGAGTLQLTSNGITVGGTLTNSTGTYDANGLATTVTGLTTLSGGTYTASTATQTFNGGLTVSGATYTAGSGAMSTTTFTISGGTFTGSSGTVTPSSSMTVSGGTYTAGAGTLTTPSLTVSGGTFTGSSGTVDLNGDFTVSSGTFTAPSSSGTLTISGNFAHSGGTFTHNSGTVTLDGSDQTLSGSTTFNNLSKTVSTARTLTFTSGTTQTIAGTMTLQGASGALLSLRSSTSGTQWSINPQGTRTIEYLDVKDSYNTNSSAITTATFNITDSGNNTGWTFNTDPSVPSSLGSTSMVNGSWTTDTTPTLSFTLSDPDSGQQVLFRIQIEDNSDFSSPVVDYSSALQSQGATSFTVGQSAGGGAYTTGSSGQTLGDSSGYYWRVRIEDSNGVTSSYTTANSGSVAFKVDSINPASVTLSSPSDGSYITTPRPTFKFKLASTPDATSGIEKYTLTVDNGEKGDFTIDNIPASRTTDYETSKFLIHYEGFGDGDGSNNYISVYTKSSSSWGGGENDGVLKEGKRTWTITAYDTAGNSKNASWIVFVDITSPTLSSPLTLPDVIDTIDSYHLLSTTLPHIKGTITDNLFPSQIEIIFIKENFFLGVKIGETTFLVEKHTINTDETTDSISFNLQPSKSMDYGKYRVEIVGIDKAGNRSSMQEFSLHILTDSALKKLLALKGKKDTKITEKQKEQTTLSIPSLEKQAVIRRKKESDELQKTIAQIGQWIGALPLFVSSSHLKEIVKVTLFGSSQYKRQVYIGGMNRATSLQKTIHTIIQKESEIEYMLADTLSQEEESLTAFLESTQKKIISTTPPLLQKIGEIVVITPVKWILIKPVDILTSALGEGIMKGTESIETITQLSQQMIGQTTQTLTPSLTLFMKKVQRVIAVEKRIPRSIVLASTLFSEYAFDSSLTNITDIYVEEVGRDYVVVSWKTNHHTYNNKVNYGETLTYGNEAWGENYTKDHKVKLTHLKPNTHYLFEVMSQGKNYIFDAYYGITTRE